MAAGFHNREASSTSSNKQNKGRQPLRQDPASPKGRRHRARQARSMRALMEAMETRTLLSVLPMPTITSQVPVAGTSGDDNNGINRNSPSIAYDPINPQKLVSVFVANEPNANGVQKVFVQAEYSTNGGKSWTAFSGANAIPANQVDPMSTSNPRAVYVQATDATVGIDRNENVYIVYSEHSTDNAEGQIVLQKYAFTTSKPVISAQTKNVNVYQWAPQTGATGGTTTDAAFTPYMTVDNNVGGTAPNSGFTDPDTKALQNDPFSGNIYVGWATVTANITNPLTQNFNPNNIVVVGSNDGGKTFSNPIYVNDAPFSGTQRDARPRLVVSQGTADGRVSPGQLTVIWDDFGSGRSASPKVDFIKSDVIQDGISATVASGTGGLIGDAMQGSNGAPDTATITSFPVTVNLSDPNFTLSDLSVSLSLVHANLDELSITLTAPNAEIVTLLNNHTTGSGGTINGQGVTGKNMGVISVQNPPPGSLNVPTIFDANAARGIRDGADPFIGTYQPEDAVNSLADFIGMDPSTLNGTWTLTITDFKSETNNNSGPTQNLNQWGLNFTGGGTTNTDVQVANTRVLGALTAPYVLQPTVSPDMGIGPSAEIASDNTLGSFSQFQGRLYVVYVDHRNVTGNPTDNTDIFLSYSDDGGSTWKSQFVDNSSGVANIGGAVNDDNALSDGFSEAGNSKGRPQFMPSVAVDQTTGTLVMTWLDARNDAARARVATYIATSIDGGATVSQETYVNAPNAVRDATTATNTAVNLGPIPDNQSSGNASRDQSFGFGDHQGLAVVAGQIHPVWAGNADGGADAKELLRILSAQIQIADGPRIISSSMGPVSLPGDSINPAAADGSPMVSGFEVKFDRPIDPATFTAGLVTVLYRSPTTAGSAPGIPVAVGSVQPLDGGPWQPGGVDGSTDFLVSFTTPQTAVGTYSYFIAPQMSDRIRTLTGTVISGNATTYAASGNQINLRIPPVGTGDSGNPAFDQTISTISIADTTTVSNLTVNINLTHTFDNDLVISLMAPDGTIVVLSSNNGGGGANYTNTIFDDSAGTSITTGSAPFTGSFQPEDSLSTLAGISVTGNWELIIEDTAAGDTGTLLGWSITNNSATIGPSNGNKLDQNSDGIGGESAAISGSSGDVYAVPTPSGSASFNGSYFVAPFSQDTLPLIVPGPHLLGIGQTYSSATAQNNLSIPTTGTGGTGTNSDLTKSTITVNEAATATVARVSVQLSLTHPADNSLIISLIAPNGTTVVLSNLRGGANGANFTNTIFDDLATTAIGAGVAPFTGVFAPDSALSALKGVGVNGTWTLQVRDTVTGTVGTLQNWSINIVTQQGQALTLNNTVNHVDIVFDRPMNPATITPASVLSFLGPAGSISSAFTITPNPLGTDPNPAFPQTYRIGFTSQAVSGTYQLTLNSTIKSSTGEALDTNLNAGVDMLRDTSGGNSSPPIPVTFNSGTLNTNIVAPNKTISSTINVTDSFVIQGATLRLNISYPNDPDLTAVLIAPDGIHQVLLFSGVGATGSQPGFSDTVFDDSATTPIQSGGRPFFGTFNPTTPFAALVGLQSFGTWTLQITTSSTASAGTGTLNNWSLTFKKPVPGTGLGEIAADLATASFRIFAMDGSNTQSSEAWTPVGPAAATATTLGSTATNGAAGQVNAIAVDPSDRSGNTVYVAGTTGGIWKTSNFLTTSTLGPTYIPLTDLGPTNAIAISSIAVFGRNNDSTQSIVFGATGQNDTAIQATSVTGVGFIRSMDGGSTWTLLDSSTNVDSNGNILPANSPQRDHIFVGSSIFKIIVDPTAAPSGNAIIYAAVSGTHGGIWRSVDSGNHWQLMRAGQATDVIFDANSSALNAQSIAGNLQILYAGFAGEGIFTSPNQAVTWNPLLGTTGGTTTVRDGTITNPPAIPVDNPGNPNGAKGRIVLAMPTPTGTNPAADILHEGWIYAAVVNASGDNFSGTLDGLYITKDFGQNWTKIDLASIANNNLTPTNDNSSGGSYRVVNSPSLPGGEGNFALSLAVDPNNPSVVYVGGSGNATGEAIIRVDTTALTDAHAFYQRTDAPDGGALRANTSDGVVTKNYPGGPASTPNPFSNPYINLESNPSTPFLANSTFLVANTASFANTGADAKWIYLDSKLGLTFASDAHRILAIPDPLTGHTRLIVGTDDGVYTALDDGDGTYNRSIGTAMSVAGTRNGNLQIAQFYAGASQPNSLAAATAGALFYGMAQNMNLVASSSNVLTTGNIFWNANDVPGTGSDVVADQSSTTGLVYTFELPFDAAAFTNFFQVNGVGRALGLVTNTGNGGPTGDPQWQPRNGPDFAVNPLNNGQIIISSYSYTQPDPLNPNNNVTVPAQIFATTTQGQFWNIIGGYTIVSDTVNNVTTYISSFDGTHANALAFGAPDPNGGHDATNSFLYAGTQGGNVYVTFTGGGGAGNSWTNISTGLDGSAIQEIITNPTRGSHEAYAVTLKGVYHMVDSAAGTPKWVNITGNLFSISHNSFGSSGLAEAQLKASSLATIQADWRYAKPVLYVGGDSGVYRSIDGGATWTLFPNGAIDGATLDGGYLPNVPVTDLDLALGQIDPTNGSPKVANSPDVLLASTYGRGSFAIHVAPIITGLAMDSADDLGGSNSDGNTSLTSPRFTGTSEITGLGNTVHITLFAKDITDPNNPIDLGQVGSGTTDAQGNFDIPVTLSSGLHVYTISAQAVDDAGTVGQIVTSTAKYPNGITIDTSQPSVTQVTSTVAPASEFNTGATVPVIVVFNEPVFVDTSKGAPTLTLNDGGTATYASGSGTANLTFNYVVGAGQNTSDLDYNTNGLTIAAGAVVNAAGGDALTSLNSASDFLAPRNIIIDTIAPTVTAVDSTSPGNQAYGSGQTITITIAFSETVVVTGTPKLQLNSGGSASYTSGSNSSVLTFTYTVGANQNSSDLDYASVNALTGTIRDMATNSAVLTLPTLGTSALKAKNIVIGTGTPGKPTMTTSTDTGASQTDGITNNNKPTFTGVSSNSANATVQLVLLDPNNNNAVVGSPIGSGAADGNGLYSITLSSSLADGAYRVAARSATGVISTGFQDIVIDTAAPSFTVPGLSVQTGTAFTGAFAHLNADAHPPVTSPFSSVTITYGDGSPATTPTPPTNGGDIDINHTWAVANTYPISVTITDVAGNSATVNNTATVADIITPAPTPQATLKSEVINSGQHQISHIDTIDFAFNNDVPFPDVTLSSLTLLHNGGDPASLAGAVLTYDIDTGVGHLDLRSVTLADGDYQLQINVGTSIPDYINFPKLTGDTNGDGVVNQKDLTAVTNALNSSGSLLDADANGDGHVDQTDRQIVKSHLNHRLAKPTTAVVKLLANGKVSAPAIHFGRVKAGTTVMAVDLVVKNSFGKAIQLSRAAIAGDTNAFHFALPGKLWASPSSDVITIAAGQSLTIRVYFTPNNDGATSAKLTCRYTDGGFISYGNAIASMNATIFG